jgi:hypothetical protein
MDFWAKMGYEDIISRIKKVQEFDPVAETMDIIEKNADFIKELLRGQLASGRDGQGKPVTLFGRDFYADSTIFYKERHGVGIGKITDHITNYDSGTFYSMLKVRTAESVFEITSDVEYFNDIIARSGSVIMELDSVNMARLANEVVIPQLKQRFNSR